MKGNETDVSENELEPIYFEKEWKRFTLKRNGTDLL
jgi:hypothetical protein